MNLLILNVVIVTSRVQICLWGDLSLSFIHLVLPQIDILRSISSQFHVVLLFLGGFSNDAWVWGQEWWLSTEGVCWSCHKLAFVVGAIEKLSKSIMYNHYLPSVSDYDLRRVLVWHDDSWLRKTTSGSFRVVRSEWLSCHACMKVLSLLEHLTKE